jgi:XTP/dITP diphosphohydrolase
MKTIFFITGNKGKALEAQKKLLDLNIEIVQKNIGYPEIQANNLEDVAIYGAEKVVKKIDNSFILEDAGLFVNSLDGFPGVYSAYVFHTIGCKGILKLMEDVPEGKRKAVFKSVCAYVEPDIKPMLFVGECKGSIAYELKGYNGFGFDPIFIPDGYKKTFAEMETDEKNKISHRGHSLKKLIDYFKKISL